LLGHDQTLQLSPISDELFGTCFEVLTNWG
jgi:hypothetical protein